MRGFVDCRKTCCREEERRWRAQLPRHQDDLDRPPMLMRHAQVQGRPCCQAPGCRCISARFQTCTPGFVGTQSFNGRVARIFQHVDRGLLRERSDVKFVFIARYRNIWPEAGYADAVGVSRSDFHAWLNRTLSARSRSDGTMSQQVKASSHLFWKNSRCLHPQIQ